MTDTVAPKTSPKLTLGSYDVPYVHEGYVYFTPPPPFLIVGSKNTLLDTLIE